MAWFKDWFNTPYYHILYQDRDYREGESFLTKLLKYLNLKEHAFIIDLGCGKGRHSMLMNRLGFDVLGLDLSEENIRHNRQFESKAVPQLQFAVHDMRNEIYPKVVSAKADAVFNLFTSFGYFDDEEDDRRVFQSVRNALKKDGIFVLDFLNAEAVKHSLEPHTVKTKNGIDFNISKKIEGGHVVKNIDFEADGSEHHYFEKVKLHSAAAIEKLAENEGFAVLNIFGDYALNNYDPATSARCLFILKAV